METTNEKECPECHSKDIFESRSGIGQIKENGPYAFEPLNEIFCECGECGEKFSYLTKKD